LGLFYRGFVTLLIGCSLTGCEEAASPILVQPTVSAASVPDAFEFFFASDPASFVAMANERLSPAHLEAGTMAPFTPPVEPGYRVLVRAHPKTTAKVFFGLKIRRGFVGVVMPRSSEDHVIAPVAWLHDIVTIGLADETAAHNWYVAMSQRLATAGKASGVAVFSNGNAMGINIDLVHDAGDDELVARLKFMRAGEYKVEEWGPRIDGESVANSKMNGHDGITMEDLLRQELTPAGGAPHPAPVSSAPATPPPAPSSSVAPASPATNL
jgi:hypothetical protein